MVEIKTEEGKYLRKDDTELVATNAEVNPNETLSNLIGEDFAEYRRLYERATNFEKVSRFPLHIDFEINYACNLKCPSCIFDLPTKERPPEPAKGKGRKLDTEVFKKVIKDGVPLGLYSIGLSYFNEPFLRTDCLDLVEWALNNGIIDVHLGTNGTLLTEERAKRILEMKVPRVSFSLDAFSKETYKIVRKGAERDDTYGKILRFLELKRQGGYKLPLTRVSFCRSTLNEHEIDDFVNFWKDKIDYYAIQEYIAMVPSQEQYRAVSHQSAKAFRCPQPYQRLIIRSDGTVLPCCVSFGTDIPMGNCYDTPVEEIWNSKKMEALRKVHKEGRYKEIPACKKCAEKSTGN